MSDHGWRTLGDIGYLDSDGYLYLTDRHSHMIVSGGVNIYPQETENVLATHPAVLDVAVIGVPNAEDGEEVKAVVQLGDQEGASATMADDLIEYRGPAWPGTNVPARSTLSKRCRAIRTASSTSAGCARNTGGSPHLDLVTALKTLRSALRFRRLELNPTTRRLRAAVEMGDLRRLAERSLPWGVSDYVDGGAEDELTLRRNVEAFQRLEFRPRVLRDVGAVDTTRRLLGRTLPLPLVLGRRASPVSWRPRVSWRWPVRRLATASPTRFPRFPPVLSRKWLRPATVLNGFRFTSGATVAWSGRCSSVLDGAGYEAIVLTVDTPVLGRRERDVRHGFTLPPQLGLETLLDGVRHPAWTWRFVRSDPIEFANVAGRSAAEVTDAVHPADYISAQFDPTVSWPDLEWFRSHWSKPIVVKGIQSVDDAVVAADLGLDAIALSNHGGRQVDGSPAPELVAPVAAAVGGRVEIICDGGIRRGGDIVKAMALGATVGMIGRAYLYGLGAAGERGVDHVLEHLADGMRRTMALNGHPTISDLSSASVSWRPPHGEAGRG